MNIGIIGLGLIGGSLGRALNKLTDHKVYGRDIAEETVLKADLLSAISDPLTEELYRELDVIVYALNPRDFESELKKDIKAGKFKDGAVIMDICGVKRRPYNIMKQLASEYPKLQFIATHPMAGKEYSGISHSAPTLFERASVLLVPVNAELETLVKIKQLFLSVGFEYVKMTTAAEHDKIITFTSQLPHIISSAYINSPLAELHDGYSAGSFRDMSRVARMNSRMWAELFCENRDNLTETLNIFIKNVQSIREAIVSNDETSLRDLLEQGNKKKEETEKIVEKRRAQGNKS